MCCVDAHSTYNNIHVNKTTVAVCTYVCVHEDPFNCNFDGFWTEERDMYALCHSFFNSLT